MYFKDPKDQRSLIINALMERHPLAVADIKTILTRKHKRRFTPQGLHKTLNRLIQDKVVVRQSHAYSLATDYILELGNYVQLLREKYFQPFRQTFYVPKNGHMVFHPESIAALDILWNKIIKEKMDELRKDGTNFMQHFPHAWFNLVHLDEEIKIVAKILEQASMFLTLVNGNSRLDAWVGKFYKGPRMNYNMRKQPDPKEQGHCYGVLGPYVLETYYPRSIASRLDNIFNSANNLQELNLAELVALANTSADLKLTLYNNSQMAYKYRHAITNELWDQHPK